MECRLKSSYMCLLANQSKDIELHLVPVARALVAIINP
jgi:hypothetical protein